MEFLGDFESGDAADGEAVRLIAVTIRANVSGAEAQVPWTSVGEKCRGPEAAVRTSNEESTTAPGEIARHHNRKRKAAESSGRKSAKNLERGGWFRKDIGVYIEQ